VFICKGYIRTVLTEKRKYDDSGSQQSKDVHTHGTRSLTFDPKSVSVGSSVGKSHKTQVEKLI
jgi:hypothetical protein